jgi:serine/threonine protein phosphatase PrpC
MKASQRLVDLANEQGGADNVTAVVVHIIGESKGWFSWLRRGSKKTSQRNGSAGGK